MEPQELQNTNNQNVPEEPPKRPDVGFKDQSGAVIIRPEDVYGKVDTAVPLEKATPVSPVPVSASTAPINENPIQTTSPQSTITVPNFPTTATEPLIRDASLTSLNNEPIYSKPVNEAKVPLINLKDAPMVGMSGSDLEKRHFGAQSLGILRIFLTILVIFLFIIGILALDLYFEVSLGGSLIYKLTGFDIFKTLLNL